MHHALESSAFLAINIVQFLRDTLSSSCRQNDTRHGNFDNWSNYKVERY